MKGEFAPYVAEAAEGWSLVKDSRDGEIVATFPYRERLPGASRELSEEFHHQRAVADAKTRNEAALRERGLLLPYIEAGSEQPVLLTAGRLKLDPRTRGVWLGDDEISSLTDLEYRLLVALLDDPARVFTRDELQFQLWGQVLPGSRSLDTHAVRLRAKLGPEFVQNVRSVGYRLLKPAAQEVSNAA